MRLRRGPARGTGKTPDLTPTGKLVLLVFFVLVGVGMLIWAGIWQRDTQRFEATAEHADGVVVDNTRHREGENWISYQVISFRTADERTIRFEAAESDVGFFHGAPIGGRVRVAYDPQNPQDARVDTVFRRWGGPSALIFGGLVFISLAAFFWRRFGTVRGRSAGGDTASPS